MIGYNPPLKFVVDLEKLKLGADMTMTQLPPKASLESLSSVNFEIDIENNQLILNKSGMNFESKIVVKKWYK